MKYSGIIKDDIANGTGIRTSLFVSGCRNHCPGCFNKEQQDFNYGQEFTIEVQDDILESVDDEYHSGISILGGDPMEPENAKELLQFIYRFRMVYGSNKSIWMWTGYKCEDLLALPIGDPRKDILFHIDVLVDGPFIESLKSLTIKFRGSTNQRIINIQDTIKNQSVVELRG